MVQAGTKAELASVRAADTVLVTSGDDGYLSLQYANGSPLFTLPPSPPSSSSLLPSLTCLALTSGSRYVACGDASSRLTIWDLKRQQVNRRLDGHTDEVTAIDLSPTSSASPAQLHIASGSVSSSVLVHDLETGHIRASFTLPQLSPVRAVRYSPLAPSLLACGGDDGAPYLHDLATSSASVSLSSAHAHSAALSSLLFSPVHPSLLLSTSLSCAMTFHDLRASTIVHRGSASSAILCADWADDGYHVVVGVRGGAVEVFDVRREGERVASWKAHSSDVLSVRWQRTGAAKGAKADRARLKERDTPSSMSEAKSAGVASTTPYSGGSASLGSTPYSHSMDTPTSTRPSSRADGAAADHHHVPVTPYVPHSKPYAAAGQSVQQPISSSSSATSAAVSSSASSLASSTLNGTAGQPPLSLRAADDSKPSSESTSPSLSGCTDERSPPSFPDGSLSASPLRLPRSPSARRSSFPAPAPFSSTILPASTTSSSFSSPRRSTVESAPFHPSPTHLSRPVLPEEQSRRLPPAPAASSSLLSSIEAVVDRRCSALYADVHSDLCNLQLDVFRQFHAQSMELAAALQSVTQQNADMAEQVAHLREELRQSRR